MEEEGVIKGREKPFKTAIVGCGQIAEHHLKFLVKSRNIEVVALADRDINKARELGEIFGVTNFFSSIDDLLNSNNIDVLHVLTPPQFHLEHAKKTFEKGVHAFIEKPMALTLEDTQKILDMAEENNVKVCTDYIHLFNPIVLEAKNAIEKNKLGTLIHADCFMGVDLDMPEHKEATGLHWHYTLPGGLMHDFISHPLYKVINWIGPAKRITTHPHSYGTLPQGLTDHIDVLLEGEKATGKITLTFVPAYPNYYLNLFFERGTIKIDFITQTTIVEKIMHMPGAAARVLLNFDRSFQYTGKTVRNVVQFLRKKMVPYHGLEYLIKGFYEYINNNNPPPISKDLILGVAYAEDKILHESGKVHLENVPGKSSQKAITKKEKILVTGATGYLGKELIQQLVNEGYYVRAYVRKASQTGFLERLGVELIYGDIREPEILKKAAQDMDVIVHCAASLSGSESLIMDSIVKGSKHMASAAEEAKVKQVIYISSFSVFDFYKAKNGTNINEESLLETRPELRGASSTAKRLAEDVAMSNLSGNTPAWTILRPSIIVGNGKDIPSLIGSRIGNILICFGRKNKHIPLIHIKDLVKAITISIGNKSVENKVFNISHEDQITANDIVKKCFKRNSLKKLRPVYIPYSAGLIMIAGFKVLKYISGKGPGLNSIRLAYACRDLTAISQEFTSATGWQPEEPILLQLNKEIESI